MDIGLLLKQLHQGDPRSVARAISLVEDRSEVAAALMMGLQQERFDQALVVGITGPPGAGKSTLTNALVRCLREQEQRVGIIAIDPSSPLTHGALLGDRIRMMDHALDRDVVVRSMATRGRLGGLCAAAGAAIRIMAASGCRILFIETVGVGQSEMDVAFLADVSVMVLAPGFGDDIQAMKAGILEVVDLLVINKADQPGAKKLLLDLGTETANSDRLLQTVASEQQGIAELLTRILSMEEVFRKDAQFMARRKRSRSRETLDRVMELLRDRLRELVREEADNQLEPGAAAAGIVARIMGD